MREEKKNVVLSVLVGIACGLMMALLLLYMMIIGNFTIDFTLVLFAVIGCALPQCLSFLKKYEMLSVDLITVVMIVLSYVVTLIYGVYMNSVVTEITQHNDILRNVLILSSIIHGVSLVMTLIIRKGKKS